MAVADASTILKIKVTNPYWKGPLALPFVKDFARQGAVRRTERSFWVVEPTGNYAEDIATGHRIAVMALTYARDKDARSVLAPIIYSMVKIDRKLTGIEVGFVSAIMELALLAFTERRGLLGPMAILNDVVARAST